MTHLDLERNLTHKRDTSLQNQIVTQKLSKTLKKKQSKTTKPTKNTNNVQEHH